MCDALVERDGVRYVCMSVINAVPLHRRFKRGRGGNDQTISSQM